MIPPMSQSMVVLCCAVMCSVYLDLISLWLHAESCWARFGTRFRQFLSGCAAKLVFFTGRSPQNLVCWFVGLLVCWFVGFVCLFVLFVCLFCLFCFCVCLFCLFVCLVGCLFDLFVCLFIGWLVGWLFGFVWCVYLFVTVSHSSPHMNTLKEKYCERIWTRGLSGLPGRWKSQTSSRSLNCLRVSFRQG